MVIACPNCQRKYQIDTSRIPSGGTSFTCWSCRAAVRVDPIAAASAPPPTVPQSPRIAEPPATETSQPSANSSTIPMSAMRFFESLAGEASLNKQMANQAPPMIPVSEPVEPEAPPPQKPSGPLDLLTGDDVLDLPQMIPVAGTNAVEEGRVLDLDTLEPADPREVETTLSFPPVSREAPPEPFDPPEPMRTKFFASPSPEAEPAPPEPLPPPPLSSLFDVPGNNGASEAPPDPPPAPPRPRPAPTPIPLPIQAQEPTPLGPIEPQAEPSRVRFSAPLPPPPIEPPDPTPPPPVFEPPVFAEAPHEPARPALAQKRVTPGEMAVADEAAWGDPIVVHDPEPASHGRSLGVPLLLAVVIVALCGFLSYKYVLLPYFGQAKTSTKATSPPQQRPVDQPATPAPAPQAPATPAPAPQPQTQTPPAEQPVTPTAPTPAPTGVGGFTVQVRSSPNEADAKAAVASLAAAGFEAYVVRADLGARGVWYRVRVGRFESREDARKTAAKLRSSGGASDAIIQVYEAP